MRWDRNRRIVPNVPGIPADKYELVILDESEDQAVSVVTEARPRFHRWVRVEEASWWRCVAPPEPRGPSFGQWPDVCDGCGEVVLDEEMYALDLDPSGFGTIDLALLHRRQRQSEDRAAIRGSEDQVESEDLVALPWWSKCPIRVGIALIAAAVVVDLIQIAQRLGR